MEGFKKIWISLRGSMLMWHEWEYKIGEIMIVYAKIYHNVINQKSEGNHESLSNQIIQNKLNEIIQSSK